MATYVGSGQGGGSAGRVIDGGATGYPDGMDEMGLPDDQEGASELKAWVQAKARKALNRGESEESNRRVDLYDRYLGEKYGDEEDGYSQLVTRECFESVFWTKPELLRVFLSTPRIVEFVPQGPEDVDAAEQETDAVNYMMRRRKGAYSAFRDWVIDFLIYPTAYLKVWWDEAERWVESHYEGQTAEQLTMLQVLNPGMEVVRVTERMEPAYQVPVYDVTVRMLDPNKTGIRIKCTPPEEVLVDNLHTEVSLDECRFVCHYREMERTDLIAMGYDRDLVENLQTSRALSWSTERVNRKRFETEQSWSSESREDGTDTIEVYEVYANYDFDDDGYAEKRFIFIAGDTILENRLTDYQPFCAATSNPLPHRHLGLSMLEVVEDIQRRATALTRQMHDNLYRTNRPRQFVPPGVNLDQMNNYAPHGTVSVDDASQIPQPEVVPTCVDKVLPALDKVQEEGARRTGVSPGATTLDPDVLAQTTMGAYLAALEKSNGPFEMMVRDWAEDGVGVAACKVHELLLKHQNVPLMMHLRDEWVPINPAEWATRTDLIPLVGLGTGNRDQRIAEARLMGEVQAQAMEAGLSTPDRLYRSMEDFANAMGKPAPSLYFLDPNSPEGQQAAQARAQQQAQEQQAMQQAAMAQINVALEDISQRTMRELAKIRADFAKHEDRLMFDYDKLETEQATNIPGQGTSQ